MSKGAELMDSAQALQHVGNISIPLNYLSRTLTDVAVGLT